MRYPNAEKKTDVPIIGTRISDEDVQTTVDRYSNRFVTKIEEPVQRLQDAAQLSAEYYALATDFYLYGWGRLFHFAMRKKGESLKDSLLRYEKLLVEKLQLKEGEKCLDIGCGVGGPMINIAKQSNAVITGINNCSYQIQKGNQFIVEEGVEKNCSFLNCNWMDIPLESESFDKAYAIDATCHAADKRKQLFTEINRLLKPGALFANYEWVMTEKFNPSSPEHQNIKQKIELGNGIPNLNYANDVWKALEDAGFEIIECKDMARECDKETPWYLPLKGELFSLKQFRTSPMGRFLLGNTLRLLEVLHIVPRGTAQVHRVLETAAEGLVKGGEKDIFTPMLFFLAKKVR